MKTLNGMVFRLLREYEGFFGVFGKLGVSFSWGTLTLRE